MTCLGGLAIGFVVHQAARRRLPLPKARGLAGAAALAAIAPAALLLLAVGAVPIGIRRLRLNRATRHAGDPGPVGRTLLIGLSAGLPLAAALDLAADEVDPELGDQIRSILRRGSREGLAAALATAGGPARRLWLLLARAHRSGASALRAVASYVDEERKTRRAEALEAARRLPVKLIVPLSLLILPGFVLLTVGPTVVATFQRLLGPLLP